MSDPTSMACTVHLANLQALCFSSLASTAPLCVSNFWRQSTFPANRESHSFNALMFMNWTSFSELPWTTASCSQRATSLTPSPRSHSRYRYPTEATGEGPDPFSSSSSGSTKGLSSGNLYFSPSTVEINQGNWKFQQRLKHFRAKIKLCINFRFGMVNQKMFGDNWQIFTKLIRKVLSSFWEKGKWLEHLKGWFTFENLLGEIMVDESGFESKVSGRVQAADFVLWRFGRGLTHGQQI
jgi:hypothetical protein